MADRLDATATLVTGASSGIGEAVAVLARRGDGLDALVSDIEGSGSKALAIEADVTGQQQAIGAVGRMTSKLGRLDTIFDNAGVMPSCPVEDAPILIRPTGQEN